MAADAQLVLLIASAALAAVLERLGITAGLLLGPLIVGIAMAATGRKIDIPTTVFRAAQSLVGVLIAGSITAGIVRTVGGHLPLFVGATLLTLLASGLLGWLLSRWQVLPGTVAIWGSMPGAGTAMVLMAKSFGADTRLVAVMTYSRVVCVAAVASILAAIASGHAGGHPPGGAWFPPIHPLAFGETIGVAVVGAIAGVMIGDTRRCARRAAAAGRPRSTSPGWCISSCPAGCSRSAMPSSAGGSG